MLSSTCCFIAFFFCWRGLCLGGPQGKTKESLNEGEEWLDEDITDILGYSVTVFLRHRVLHRSAGTSRNRGALPVVDKEGLHTGEGLGSAVLRPVLHRHQRDHSEGSLKKRLGGGLSCRINGIRRGMRRIHQRRKRDSGQEDTPFPPPAPAARISPHSPARKTDSSP